MSSREDDLRREAAALHRALFGCAVPDALADRYVALNVNRLEGEAVALWVDVRAIVARSLDVEAIEFALRMRERDNLLTRKLHALSYLAEVRSAYFPRYVSQRDRPLAGLSALALAVARSAYKLAKGRLLLLRHRVV